MTDITDTINVILYNIIGPICNIIPIQMTDITDTINIIVYNVICPICNISPNINYCDIRHNKHNFHKSNAEYQPNTLID